jgi:hypothetical protein
MRGREGGETRERRHEWKRVRGGGGKGVGPHMCK